MARPFFVPGPFASPCDRLGPPMSAPRILFLVLLSTISCACPPDGANEAARRATVAKPAGVKTPLSRRFDARTQGFAFVLPQLWPVQGVDGVRAADCGVCHVAIYKRWQQSTHAAALRDIQYQAEIHKKSSPRWLCLNCHIPVSNQRRHLVRNLWDGDVMRPVLEPNPGFDRAMQKEAITCAVCHVRPDATGASVVLGPRGSPRAPHPTRAAPKALRDICLRCHDPKGERITPLLVCWFETQKELSQSAHGKQGRHCVHCHMPTSRRRLAADFTEYPVRDTRQHSWVGGGIPKEFTGYRTLLDRGYEPGLDTRLVEWKRAGGQVRFSLALHNARAGHMLPTADPERHLQLLAIVQDSRGKRLASTRGRIGQTWKWHPRAEKVADNRLQPDERRRWSASLKLPAVLEGARLVLSVLHVRLTAKNAHHMQSTPVSEIHVKGIKEQVKQIQRHYPMATYLYREQIDIDSGARTRSTQKELLELSRREQSVPLNKRDY